MNKNNLLFWLIILPPLFSLGQQKCNCETDFRWVKETFEKNDAGFSYGIQQKGDDIYKKYTETLFAKAKNITTQKECTQVIQKWLRFFRKGHFSISSNYLQPDPKKDSWESIAVTENQIKEKIAKGNASPYEGIWTIAKYTIGIVKKGDEFKGVILASENQAWTPGKVKFTITKDGSGVFYLGDYSPLEFTKAALIGNNTLKLEYEVLARVYPKMEEDSNLALYAKEASAYTPFIQKLSPKTVLFCIPTFNGTQKTLIDSTIRANDELIKSTENLIIDIRDNGGGSDDSYEKIIPFLYTNPIRTINTELYSTPLNNLRMMDFYDHPEKYGFTEEDRKWAKKSYDTLQKHLGQFVNLNDGRTVNIQQFDSILPMPKNVAIIINEHNGSTAEEFLLAARQSKKVKLYGITTMGVLDISNMYFVDSPDKLFTLGYSLSKSLRIPDMAIDGKGIIPDFYIDKSIRDFEWLSYVQKILEK